MADTHSTVWKLDKYARYGQQESGNPARQWKYFDDCPTSRLVMTLTDTKYLVVLQGSVVLESHTLATARAWMRGMCKTDSFLFLYKHGKGTRRFKVKFSDVEGKTASQVCQEAAVHLSSLFSVHLTTPQTPTTAQQTKVNDKSASGTTDNASSGQLQGNVSLATMAQVVLGDSSNQLPDVYKMTSADADDSGLTALPDDVVASHLRLVLADPMFPAFVAQVEKQLNEIVKECRE